VLFPLIYPVAQMRTLFLSGAAHRNLLLCLTGAGKPYASFISIGHSF